jgi:tRNA (guanine37-N1)-methyltransferase
MKIDVITIFPKELDLALSYSIIKRARESGIVDINFVNPRDFTKDKHKTVDDKPYGGGSGMVFMPDPLYKAIKKVKRKSSYVVLLTPRGRVYNQKIAEELSTKKHLIFVCAHYEGYDERIVKFVDDEISIGDFILTGGEPACICVIDSIVRLVDGVIKDDSRKDESFNNYLLEYPHYTRPKIWKNMKVPDVLLSGNHKEIEKWRKEKSLEITKVRRPDLYKKYLMEVR